MSVLCGKIDYMNDDRALATIRRVADVRPIPGADAIECLRIDGWDVVSQKGNFQPGDLCVYFEIDALLPIDRPMFADLEKLGTKTQDGIVGHRLKTAKMRGQISQGLAIPLSEFPELDQEDTPGHETIVGMDVTRKIGITKWDPPLPAELAGVARGYLPVWIPRTKQERVQNLSGDFMGDFIVPFEDEQWLATEKIDGESVTIYIDGDYDGLCARTTDMIESEDNAMWRIARQFFWHKRLREEAEKLGIERAWIQGEFFGYGVKRNPLRVPPEWRTIGMFGFGTEAGPVPRQEWPDRFSGGNVVPVHDLPFPDSVDEALAQVDKLTTLVPGADVKAWVEGVVWTSSAGRSFKVIRNAALIKAKD